MSMQCKKARERFFLEKLRTLRPDLITGDIEEFEEPDFRFKGNDGCIVGIELTEVLNSDSPSGNHLQAQDSIASRVVDRAKIHYDALGAEPVIVSVHFNPAYAIRKIDVNRLATSLVKLAQRNLPAAGEMFEEIYNWVNRSYFPEEISSVSLFRLEGQEESSWLYQRSVWVPTLSTERLDSVVQEKSARSSVYRQNCERLWLLIVADGLPLASIWAIEKDLVNRANRREFDRAFVLHDRGKLYELGEGQGA